MAKRLFTAFFAIFIAFCLSSCGYMSNSNPSSNQTASKKSKPLSSSDSGNILNLCMFEVDSLNPLNTQNEANLDVLGLIFDGLFTVKSDFSAENNLCQSYTLSEDGLTYSFVIKDGIKFHDGSYLDAEDVDASFKLILTAQSPYCHRFTSVAESTASSMTWKVTLEEPIINFPSLLDFPIIPKEDAHTENTIKDIAYIPNGTGLYKVSAYKATKELMLTSVENHFSGNVPKISNIKVLFVKDKAAATSMFDNLYIDILPESIANFDEYTPKRELLKKAVYPKNEFTFLGINNQKTILLTSSARRAISMCIDKASIINNTKTKIATPSDIPINPNFVYTSKEITAIPYDITAARSLLLSDGFYDADGDGFLEKNIYDEVYSLTLNILVNSENAERFKTAETIKSAMEKAGFKVTITTVDYETYSKRIANKEYDLFIGSLNLSQNYDLSFMLRTDGNMFGFSNTRADLCLSQLKVLSNTASISGVYNDLCYVLAEEMPIAGIYFDNGIIMYSDKIKGEVKPAESDIFINIHEWYITNNK